MSHGRSLIEVKYSKLPPMIHAERLPAELDDEAGLKKGDCLYSALCYAYMPRQMLNR